MERSAGSVYSCRVQTDPRGTAREVGSSPTHPLPSGGLFQGVKKVAAIPGNMAKFALNQNLPGKCAKWCLCVYRSTPGAQVPTQPCSSLLCRVVRGPFIKVDNVLAVPYYRWNKTPAPHSGPEGSSQSGPSPPLLVFSLLPSFTLFCTFSPPSRFYSGPPCSFHPRAFARAVFF